MKTKIALLVSALLALGLGACGGGGGNSRTIEVDYRNDDFAGAFIGFYPRDITVKPGMTLKFHQTWSGEPHSVTTGTVVDDGVKKEFPALMQLFRDFWAGKGLPPDAPEDYLTLFEDRLPSFFGEEIDQGAAQPCYLTKAADLPTGVKPCKQAQQKQTAFDGRQAYYSSGFIPFEGARSNKFEMKIADDAKEGTYFYYCNVHGGPMGGEITIKKDADVESQAAINRRGKAQADKDSAPVLKVLQKERAGQSKFPLPLAGSGDETTENVEATALEFTPHSIQTTVGKPVTWTFIGEHTISFNVPAYTPIFKTSKTGKVSFNEGLDGPKGGWPGAPGDTGQEEGPPPPPATYDAGEFDGSGGLKSSGTGFNDGDKYTVTFTKPGTYPYACLIHPGMIGKVVVK